MADNKVTASAATTAIANKDGEYVRQLLINGVPKFGNDNDEIDYLVRDVALSYCQEVQKYTKEMVVESNLFGGDRDIIMTILEEGKEYSRDEIQAEVEKFKTAYNKHTGFSIFFHERLARLNVERDAAKPRRLFPAALVAL